VHAQDRLGLIVVSAEGKTGTTPREGYGESDWLLASFLMNEARVCSQPRYQLVFLCTRQCDCQQEMQPQHCLQLLAPLSCGFERLQAWWRLG